MKTRRFVQLVAAMALLTACGGPGDSAVHQPGEHALVFQRSVRKTVGLKYHLYLPEGYDAASEQTWPLILFLHGAGERGDDLERVKIHGYRKMLRGRPDFPFILVSPLCPDDSWWTERLDDLAALLDEVSATYRVDSRRIYLTGLSMGGQGAWYLALRYPDRFAAVAPICGWSIPYLGCKLKDVPVWAFHGGRDQVVPPAQSEQMVAAIMACGGAAKLTLYPETGHDAWTATYTSPELTEWFLGLTL